MLYKRLFQNASIFALIVLFTTSCLFPMNLSAKSASDMDSLHIHDVAAVTMTSITYNHPDVVCGSYAGIWNSSNIPVRYYWHDELAVYRKGAKNPYKAVSDWENSSVNPGDSKTFYPEFTINMSGALFGKYFAYSDVSLELKFDFNGDNVWDDTASVSSSAELEFDVKRRQR